MWHPVPPLWVETARFCFLVSCLPGKSALPPLVGVRIRTLLSELSGHGSGPRRSSPSAVTGVDTHLLLPSPRPCVAASTHLRLLRAAFALCLGAAWGIPCAPGAGALTLQCDIISMTTAQASCQGPSRRSTLMHTASTLARFVVCWSSGTIMGRTPRCRPDSRAQAARPGAVPPAASAADPLPNFADVLAAEVPTVRHVPKVARAAWAQCLARAIASTGARNTPAAWLELLMLPKAVLVAPLRGGLATEPNWGKPPSGAACAGSMVRGLSCGRNVCLSHANVAVRLACPLRPATPVAAALLRVI